MESWGYRMTKTVLLIFIWICMGLYTSIYGATLIDLKMLFNTSYGRLSTAIAARGIGSPVAAIISGILADKFPNWLDMMVALSAMLAAISTAVVPYVSSTEALWFLCFCSGYAMSSTDIGGQLLIITMWREKTTTPLHATHGGFGIGAVLIPLLVNPLLAVTQTNPAIQNRSVISQTNQNFSTELTIQDGPMITNQTFDIEYIAFITQHTGIANYSNDDVTSYLRSQSMNASRGLDEQRQNTTVTVETGNEITIIKETRIQFAYLAVALVTCAAAVPFFIFQYIKYKEERNIRNNRGNKPEYDNKLVNSRTLREIINPATYTDGHLYYGIGMFILLFVFYGNVVGGEQMFGLFVRSFSVDSLGFSKDEASYLNMVYWLGFTVARMLLAGLAHLIHIKYLISIEVTLLIVSVTVLDILGANAPLTLWIFTAILGLLFGPLSPSGISYANTVMEVSGVCMTIMVLGSGVGDVLYSSLAGTFYDIVGPRSILYAMQASGTLIFVAVVVMRIITCGRKERYMKDNESKREEVIHSGYEVKPIIPANQGEIN